MLLLPAPSKPATVILALNLFKLEQAQTFTIKDQPTLREWLDGQGLAEFRLPTICLIDEVPVLRAEWPTRRIQPGETVAFVQVPGIQAAFLAPLFTGLTASIVAAVINIVISIGISYLANALIGPPKTASNKVAADAAAASPTYNVQAQGNNARLGSSIPVIYGTLRVYPDFASAPYVEYAGNEQYLYQLFCIGLGEYDILDTRIEDTPISSFPECQVLGVYAPGQAVSGYPAAVYTSLEVSGQDLEPNVAVGHFIVNPTETLIHAVAVDVVAPQGMYYSNDDGGLDSRGASFIVQAAPVDASGNLSGAFISLGSPTISGATVTPIRQSFRYGLPSAGRWAVKITRSNAKDTSARAGNGIQWQALRGYTNGSASFAGVTTVAMKFRASNNLSNQSSRRVNFKVARKLPAWNPATRTFGAATATRSIVWALADICRASYGAGLADSRYDIDALYALEQVLAARNAVFGADAGDFCDVVFDNTVTIWEALTQVARLGRAMPLIQGGVIRFVRDQQQSVYTALFSPRNMLKDSFSIDYVMPSESTVDAVTVSYWDADAMRPREVTAALPGSAAAKPAKLDLRGATSHAHAWREGMYMCAANRYRRKLVKFSTELEGHIPMVGDLIVISHDMPDWGVAGDVIGFEALYKVFTLSEQVSFETGTHYLLLRRRNGGVSGPWAVIPAVPPQPNKVMLAAGQTLDITPYLGGDAEPTHFAFGRAAHADNFQLFRVLAPIRYRDNNTVEITAVNEDTYVHSADTGAAPAPTNPNLLPTRPTRPVLVAFSIAQGGTPDAPILGISWPATAGATHYLVEISTDNEHWSRVADSLTTQVSIPVDPGHIWVRVAAAGLAVGPFLVQEINAGVVPPPGVVQGLAAVETFTGTKASIHWTPTKRATSYRLEVWAAGVKRRDAVTTAVAYSYTSEDVRKDGGPWRVLTFKVWAVSPVGESESPAVITLSNPQVSVITGIQLYAGFKSVMITYDVPTDTDFAGVQVLMMTNAGGTPTEVYRGKDKVITIPNCPQDILLYFWVTGYDEFGLDGLNYGASHTTTVASYNLPTPQEVKDDLQTALSAVGAQPLVFNADTFAITSSSIYATPFIVGIVSGQPVIQMDASVYVLGPLSASQIRTGEIQADQHISLGGGNVILNGSGSIIVYDPDSPDPDHLDYSLFTAGRLTFQAYRDGAYHEQKSVKRVEFGVADSGTTITIPGWWDSQPSLVIGPKSLQSYNASYPAQNQSWLIEARNLRETATGSQRWMFDAVAELTLSSSTGSTTAGSSQGWGSSNTFTSLEYTLISGTSQITVSFSAGSYRGTGAGTYTYAYRSVRWKVQLFNNALSVWEDANSFRTVNIPSQGAVQTTRLDTAVVTVGSGRTKVRIYAESYDTGGVYSTGANVYEYGYGAWGTTNTNSNGGAAGGNPAGLPGWNSPITYGLTTYQPAGLSGWTIYGYQYQYEWRSNASSGTQHNGSVQGPGLYYNPPSGTSGYDTGWNAINFTLSYWSASASYVQAMANNIGVINYVNGQIRNTAARAMVQRVALNSASANNFFQFNSFTWSTSSAVTLATGSLNWMAVGD